MGAIYFHSNHGGGRPRGTPLRGLGKIRKWEGRCGQGVGGMGPRMREDNGGGGEGPGEGWVPACARTTEGDGMGHVPVFTGAGSPREQREGMGPRIREDNGGDGGFANRAYGLLTTRASATWGQSIFIAITGEGAHEGRPYGGWGAWEERGRRRDGSPHARGQHGHLGL